MSEARESDGGDRGDQCEPGRSSHQAGTHESGGLLQVAARQQVEGGEQFVLLDAPAVHQQMTETEDPFLGNSGEFAESIDDRPSDGGGATLGVVEENTTGFVRRPDVVLAHTNRVEARHDEKTDVVGVDVIGTVIQPNRRDRRSL